MPHITHHLLSVPPARAEEPHHTTPHHTTPHHTAPHHTTPHLTTPHHTTQSWILGSGTVICGDIRPTPNRFTPSPFVTMTPRNPRIKSRARISPLVSGTNNSSDKSHDSLKKEAMSIEMKGHASRQRCSKSFSISCCVWFVYLLYG